MSDFTQLCKDLEHYETPEWAAKAILKREVLTHWVVDPCCGSGILAKAISSSRQNIFVQNIDIHDYGAIESGNITNLNIEDFLECDLDHIDQPFTVFMNPPFSKAVEFVEKSLELGARKIVCFQRMAWWESRTRKDFWEKNPPNRVYICGDRAPSWRHDIPVDHRGGSSPTAHAWFIWEKGHPPGTLLGHIWKEDAA